MGWLDDTILLHIPQLLDDLLINSKRHMSCGLLPGVSVSRVNLHANEVCFTMLTVPQAEHVYDGLSGILGVLVTQQEIALEA